MIETVTLFPIFSASFFSHNPKIITTVKSTKNSELNWQQQLAEAFTDVNELCLYLGVSNHELPILIRQSNFPLKVPRSFVDRMEPGNPEDPLLLQVLPHCQEMINYPGYSLDPVGDQVAIAEAGVIHKYHGRALLVTTGACAINCRYCFRRNFPYSENQMTSLRQTKALNYLAANPDISEVILSGGDPLSLNDNKFSSIVSQLEKIRHLRRIRIHTRLPVVLPDRVTDELLISLKESSKQIIMVIHANHHHELSAEVETACQRLKNHGVTLLNQSVLLKNINDTARILCHLSEKLFDIGVQPYYLHLLDKAKGTGHFEVSEEAAMLLMDEIQRQLPGYLVPKLVKEVAGALSKIRLY